MHILTIFVLICLVVSLVFDRKRTFLGIKKGWKMFLNILPTLLNVLILVSVFLYLVPKETLIKWLGKDSSVMGMFIAAVLGSISLIPAFVSYPLAAILLKSGVSYQILAIFITTLLMVGVLTLPLESKYFGLKVAIIRNSLSFVGAIIIGVLIGIFI
ncbi:MAG: permease [bacterium]|nr:permease [bacterium]